LGCSRAVYGFVTGLARQPFWITCCRAGDKRVAAGSDARRWRCAGSS